MKTWKDYKTEYANQGEENACEIAALQEIASLISQFSVERENSGFTQSELAHITGLKQSALSRMESLKAEPQLSTLVKAMIPLGLKLQIVKEN